MACHVQEALGVDIGGVIIDRVNEDGEAPSEPPAIEGAFATIARLHRQRFLGSVWLVSRCKDAMEAVIIDWLDRHQFFGATGIGRDRVEFCREPREKAEICRHLGITHFIDDRVEVLSHLVGVVPHLYLFRSRASDMQRFSRISANVLPIDRWNEVTGALLERG